MAQASHQSQGKPGVDQIPPGALIAWGEVFTYGEGKYGRDNWRLGTAWHEFYGSALRHLYAFWEGEDEDQESGLLHLAHALWNVGALLHFHQQWLGVDDRVRSEEDLTSIWEGIFQSLQETVE